LRPVPADAVRRPMLLLDRDGVLNIDTGYLSRFEDFQWVPGATQALVAFAQANWYICVVTNQSGVARGYFTEADVVRLHEQIRVEAHAHGGRIDAFYYCPYHSDGVIEKYRVGNHPDRKPNPGMLLRALSDFDADVSRSIMIGDKLDDVEAGRRAGVRTIHFDGSTRLDLLISARLSEMAMSE
jgi:D-glycero-D-manno-heptose 1,7-bisphosphate phosphatase